MPRAAFSLLLLGPALARADAPVSFRTEVMAVLSRAGCNAGACHGNLNGKGGFKLSLRGENPDADYLALTRDALGRRLDLHRPDESLILQKAAMALPHEGGARFPRGGAEWQLLRRWIAEGARRDAPGAPYPVRLEVTPRSEVLLDPVDRVPLRARATFSDGSTRDVTRLACYEPSNLLVRVDPSGLVLRSGPGEVSILVRYLDRQAVARLAFVPASPNFAWKDVPANNDIDRHVFARLKALRVRPAELCSDAEFLRRAYLDALGVLPTVAETRRFLADARPGRRERLIDALVEREEFADFWALRWSDLLRNEEKVLDAKGVALFHDHVRRAILDRTPLNAFARVLIASRGSTYGHPEANYYRALRDPYTRAEATAQVFLGVRLQCARCHNHPFDRWTQTDYHRFAAFFARVRYRIIENNRRDRLDLHEFAGEQVVWVDRQGELTHPVTGEALAPRFLGDDRPPTAGDRLAALADWVARPDNPFFARAQVNRVWQHLVGRGIVDPGDDFRDSNPPSNPELLDFLARDFTAHGFDLRHAVKTILRSRVYQLSSRPADPARDDEAWFARGLVRPLQAEQLLDAAAQVTGVAPRFPGFPPGTRAGQLPGVGAGGRRARPGDGERFLAVFGKPVRSLSCECERSDDTTLARAFQLITGPMIGRMIAEEDNRVGRLLRAGRSDAEIVEELYLAALCRPPSPREREKTLGMLARAAGRRAGLEDLLWGLLNAKEFLLRR